MTIFNVDISSLNIKKELEEEFNFYQDKLNKDCFFIQELINNKSNNLTNFKIEINSTTTKSLEDISSNKFLFKIFLNSLNSNIILFPLNNKLHTNFNNISEFKLLSSFISDLNFEDLYKDCLHFKSLSTKIQKIIKKQSTIKKPKIDKNEKLIEVVNFLKSFYVNENDPILKNKLYKKYSISASYIDSMVKFNNSKKSDFFPFFINENFNTFTNENQNKNEYELLEELKILNPQLPDFLFNFIRFQIGFHIQNGNIGNQYHFCFIDPTLDTIYPFYESFILQRQLSGF